MEACIQVRKICFLGERDYFSMFVLCIIMMISKAWFYSTAVCFIVTVIVVTHHVANAGCYEAGSFVLVKQSCSCV
jgi:hypothetical protein